MTHTKRRTAVTVIAAAALIAAGTVCFLHRRQVQKHSVQFFAMDAPCSVTLYGEDCSDKVKERITELDKVISAYSDDGETAAINSAGGGKMSAELQVLTGRFINLYKEYGKVSPVMGTVINLWNVNGDDPQVPDSGKISKALESADAENITVNGEEILLENGAQLDFGAVGKGFALDEIKKLLDNEKAECAVVSFSSSTLFYGQKPDGKSFTVSVTDPEDGGELLKFSCGEGFVSTSGGYERYFEADGKRYIHIFDESTGCPAETDLTSVTVICQNGMLSDFLSTRIFLGGLEELEKWLSDDSISVIAADENKKLYCSENISDIIEITAEDYELYIK